MAQSSMKDKVLSNASQWNLEDDCFLLKWMQEISTKIEELALTSCNSLERLTANVNSGGLALDNVSNYFTSLQYAQFVESRVQSDEDEITSHTIDIQETQNEKQSKDIVKEFLLHNINMLHKWHEKYPLDFGDSYDKELSERYIYKSKNFYNDRSLPHIFGSKQWKQSWHVGLLENIDEFSGNKRTINPESLTPSTTTTTIKSDICESSPVTEKTSLPFPFDSNTNNSTLQKPTLIKQPDITEQNTLSHQLFINTPDEIEKTPINFDFQKSINLGIEDEQDNIKQIKKNANFTNEDNASKSDSFSSREWDSKNSQHENKQKANNRERKYVNLFDDNDFISVINQLKNNNQQSGSPLKNSEIITENSVKHKQIDGYDSIDQNVIKKVNISHENGDQRNNANLFESNLFQNSPPPLKKNPKESNLFKNSPPPLKKNPKESNLFKNSPPPLKKNPKEIRSKVSSESERIRKHVNLFNDNDLTITANEFPEDNFKSVYSENNDIHSNTHSDIFFETKNEPSVKKEKENEKAKANKLFLFDDEDDNDDFLNIFGKKNVNVSNKVEKDESKSKKNLNNQINNESIKNVNIFDELNEQLEYKMDRSVTKGNQNKMDKFQTDFEQSKSKNETKIDLTEEFLEDNSMNIKNTTEVNEIVPPQAINNEINTIVTKKPTHYQFTNIFLDEQPPVDEEFERTINENSYSNFKDDWKDLEEDIYESSTINDVYNKPDFNYLSLFSKTPPPSDNSPKPYDVESKENYLYDQMDEVFKNPADNLLAEVINRFVSKDSEQLNKVQSLSDGITDLVEDKVDFNEKIMHQTNLIVKNENEKTNVTQIASSLAPLLIPPLFNPKYETLSSKQQNVQEKTEVMEKWDKANILKNVCKDRVRVPSKRKPSTRKARYENYKKSENLAVENVDNQNIIERDLRAPEPKFNINEEKQHSSAQISKPLNFLNQKMNTQNSGSLFDDDSDSDDFFKSNILKKTKPATSIKHEQSKQSKASFDASFNTLDAIFGNDDEDDLDDDFMKTIKTKSKDTNRLFVENDSDESYNFFSSTTQNEKITKSTKVATNVDNPLADLLNS